MNDTLVNIGTAATLVAIAAAVHVGASVDWPWAIAVGAAATALLRAVVRRRTPVRR